MTGADAPALALDAGQTEIRAALMAGDRTLASSAGAGVARLGAAARPADVAEQLLAAIRGLGPLPSPRPPAAVGLSGYEAAGEPELAAIAAALADATGAPRTVLATDGLPALLGAVGPGDGVVVSAGTGTVCLGRRGDHFAKVDGWGALLGDAGSGFWIGRAGLDRALRCFDGRGDAEALMRAAERRFGALGDMADLVARDSRPARAVARFARDVMAVAADGDEHAAAILEAAGDTLAETACAALGRLFPADEPAVVSYAGNVLGADARVRGAFTRGVLARRPPTQVQPPLADALRGAALLAHLAPSLPGDRRVLWSGP